MVNEQLISEYLKDRGVVGAIFGCGRHGMTGPEITIEKASLEMSARLSNACYDALISRGGGGSSRAYAYRQISPEKFSDPRQRALVMLTQFESAGALTFPNDFQIYCDDKGNLIGSSGSGEIIHAADDRTKKLLEWIRESGQDDVMSEDPPDFKSYDEMTVMEKAAFDSSQGIRPSDRERVEHLLERPR